MSKIAILRSPPRDLGSAPAPKSPENLQQQDCSSTFDGAVSPQPQHNLQAWPPCMVELPADEVGPCNSGPLPPPEWSATANYLTNLARSPVPPPAWWKTQAQFRASIETHTDPRTYSLNDTPPQEEGLAPPLSFQLTLAGWGHLSLHRDQPQVITPGKAFFVAESSSLSHCLPPGSPGWTFARIDVYHPYLKSRLAKQLSVTGPLLDVLPDEPLTTSVLRLVRGALIKDFPDQFAAEMALFDFVLTFERWVQQTATVNREAERLIDHVRSQVLVSLPRAIEVCSLAAQFGMSRSYFSHFFRKRTGITPAHFATEVRIQKVEHMLLDTREPLKSIAAACGFANANHLCKVFRRFRHFTPTAFRLAFRHSNVTAVAANPRDGELATASLHPAQ